MCQATQIVPSHKIGLFLATTSQNEPNVPEISKKINVFKILWDGYTLPEDHKIGGSDMYGAKNRFFTILVLMFSGSVKKQSF